MLDPFFDWKTIGSVDFCTKIIKVPPGQYIQVIGNLAMSADDDHIEAYQAIQRAIAVADDQDRKHMLGESDI